MNPKAEIVTMNREGLAAFVLELKRTKIRHQLPQIPEEKLDKAVEVWEQQQRDIVERHRNTPAEPDDVGAMILVKAKMYDASANLMAARFKSVRSYLGSLNRDINEGRVEAYREDMRKGKWWFTPDPIVVTATGEIINGQHRLLAVESLAHADAGRVEGKSNFVPDDYTAPQFVVVWGVDKRAAILIDEARRTANDRRDIALRFASAA